jgi:hypothetical protein
MEIYLIFVFRIEGRHLEYNIIMKNLLLRQNRVYPAIKSLVMSHLQASATNRNLDYPVMVE